MKRKIKLKLASCILFNRSWIEQSIWSDAVYTWEGYRTGNVSKDWTHLLMLLSLPEHTIFGVFLPWVALSSFSLPIISDFFVWCFQRESNGKVEVVLDVESCNCEMVVVLGCTSSRGDSSDEWCRWSH